MFVLFRFMLVLPCKSGFMFVGLSASRSSHKAKKFSVIDGASVGSGSTYPSMYLRSCHSAACCSTLTTFDHGPAQRALKDVPHQILFDPSGQYLIESPACAGAAIRADRRKSSRRGAQQCITCRFCRGVISSIRYQPRTDGPGFAPDSERLTGFAKQHCAGGVII